jgi:hypothetical protein
VARLHLYASYISAALFAELCRLYPAGRKHADRPLDSQQFKAEFPLEDAVFAEILKTLARHDILPWTDHSRMPLPGKEFELIYRREYDETDFESSKLLECDPPIRHCDEGRSSRGQLKLDRHSLKLNRRFFKSSMSAAKIVVSEKTMKVLKKAKLKHLKFRPTILIDAKGDQDYELGWDGWSDPRWELTSDLVLPKMSRDLQLVTFDGSPVKGDDYSNGCLIHEGFYRPPEIHYRRKDLPPLESFDVALSYEPIGTNPLVQERALIFSNRFYQVCKELKLKADWVPVRIDGGNK